MAETTASRSTLARAGIQTAEEIMAPTPGALMRRRVFGHVGPDDRRLHPGHHHR